MKQMNLLIIGGIAVVASGCSASGAPSCDDPAVQDLVNQIVQERILDDYAKYYSPYAGGMTYKALKQAVESGSDFLSEELQKVEKDSSEAEILISGIRTQTKNDDIKKVECAAQLSIERKNALTGERATGGGAFTYSAQYSDDGSEVYVEAYGL